MFSLAPLYLGTRSARLDARCYDVVTHTSSIFLHMFLRRGSLHWLQANRVPCMVTEMVPRVDNLSVNKFGSNHQPKAWRWLTANPLADKSLLKVVITRRYSTSVHSSSHRSSKTFWRHQRRDGSISRGAQVEP